MPPLRPAPKGPALAQEVAEIPIGVRRLGAWSWRLLVIVAAAALLLWGITQISTLVIPVLLAVLLAAMLQPIVKLLTKYTFLGRGASSAVAMLGLLIVIAGMFTLAGRQLIAQWSDIQSKAIDGFQSLTTWATGTFRIDDTMISSAIDEGLTQLQQNADALLNSALSTAAVLGNVVTGIIVCLFSLFFMLSGGAGIWRWVIGLLPPQARVPTHESVRRGWKALSAYVRTQILVAAVDATGIAIGMLALGLGVYAVPIWLLVFLFSFIPLVGAILSGAIAVLLVLVLNGWVGAIIMLVVVLGVQQLEGNVLQPFLMGKAVELHPLAVFLGVAAGAMVAGIPGALFAIPIIAFVNATMLYLVGRDPSPELGTDPTLRTFLASLGRGARGSDAEEKATEHEAEVEEAEESDEEPSEVAPATSPEGDAEDTPVTAPERTPGRAPGTTTTEG